MKSYLIKVINITIFPSKSLPVHFPPLAVFQFIWNLCFDVCMSVVGEKGITPTRRRKMYPIIPFPLYLTLKLLYKELLSLFPWPIISSLLQSVYLCLPFALKYLFCRQQHILVFFFFKKFLVSFKRQIPFSKPCAVIKSE